MKGATGMGAHSSPSSHAPGDGCDCVHSCTRDENAASATFSLAFSHDGPQTYIYSADGGSHVIDVLRRSDLEVVNEFGGPGVGVGQLGRPHNLTVDPSGNIYVAEAQGPQVKNAAGAMVEAGFRAQKFTFAGVR